jgi:hypothetical protein
VMLDIAVPHTNEIAQTGVCHGTRLANFWLHGAFLQLDEARMAKSARDFLRLQTVVERGHDPLAYRLFCLSAHHRAPLHFAWEGLDGAATALHRLRTAADAGGVPGRVDAWYVERMPYRNRSGPPATTSTTHGRDHVSARENRDWNNGARDGRTRCFQLTNACELRPQDGFPPAHRRMMPARLSAEPIATGRFSSRKVAKDRIPTHSARRLSAYCTSAFAYGVFAGLWASVSRSSCTLWSRAFWPVLSTYTSSSHQLQKT